MRTRNQCEALERRTLLAAAPWEPIVKNDFADVSDMTLNGSATNADAGDNSTNRLTLTEAIEGQAGSAFFNDRRSMRFFNLPVSNGFTAEFDLSITPAGPDPAEGFFFVLHNDPRGPEALGAGGPGMGWEGVENAVGVKFDFNTGGADQTGLYVGGVPVSRDPADPRNRVLPDRLDLDSGRERGRCSRRPG